MSITKGMFTSTTDLWETPQAFFDQLNAEFCFSLDACALPWNAKCEGYYTPEQDGLSQIWTGVVWCNPPYGRKIGKWVEKAVASVSEGATVVMLLPARTDTQWFHRYIYHQAEIRFVPGRLKFGGAKWNAPFPCMVVIFRPGGKNRDDAGGDGVSLKDLIADVNVNEICEHIETETLSEWVNAWQEAALSALRPVSREQVEKVWRGKWEKHHKHRGGFRRVKGIDDMGEQHEVEIDERCEYDDLYCSECGKQSPDNFLNFCAYCGASMTDEAVEMVMERLEALNGDR